MVNRNLIRQFDLPDAELVARGGQYSVLYRLQFK